MSKIMAFASCCGLVLASGSSYRKALLDRLGLHYAVCPAQIDESPLAHEAPVDMAQRLASEKARAVSARYPNHLIIGSDQVATCDGVTALGKPLTHANAVRQLAGLSAKRAFFYTAVCLLNSSTGTSRSKMVPTEVEFLDLSATTIESYLRREHPYDCTGSAKIEGLGIMLVRKVASDDPSALIGLPLIALHELLAAEGVQVI